MTVRAKMMCEYVKDLGYVKQVRFTAQYDDTIPEELRFMKATPTGHVEMTVDNPNVDFKPGKKYYIDFTVAE